MGKKEEEVLRHWVGEKLKRALFSRHQGKMLDEELVARMTKEANDSLEALRKGMNLALDWQYAIVVGDDGAAYLVALQRRGERRREA